VSYCIRNAAGEYLTHMADMTPTGLVSSLFFTPSPWMAYTFPDREMAEMVAAAPDVRGIVATWEPPATSKRAR